MSATTRDLQLLDKVAHGGRFLYPNCNNYDLIHRRMVSCLPVFHKLYFNNEMRLSSMMHGPFQSTRPTRFTEQHHRYDVMQPHCHISQFQRCFVLYASKIWNFYQMRLCWVILKSLSEDVTRFHWNISQGFHKLFFYYLVFLGVTPQERYEVSQGIDRDLERIHEW